MNQKPPPSVPLMDTTTFIRELRATVRQWAGGHVAHRSSMARVEDLLKKHDAWNGRKC